MIIVLPMPHSASSTSDGFDHVGELNHSGPFDAELAEDRVDRAGGRVEQEDEAERRRDRRRERRQVEDRPEEAGARRARAVSAIATPSAKSTCSGTMIAISQSVLRTAGQIDGSLLNRKS